MDPMWNWPSFSLFTPMICDRFLDIPEPIRCKIVKAATDAVHESLEEVAKEIQILSLDKNPNTPEKLKCLMAEVEAAERLGFDVKEYKKRLVELASILDMWKERMDRLRKVRYGLNYARMETARLEDEQDKKQKVFWECTSVFRNVASAPWHRKDDPVKEKESNSKVI